MLGKGRIFYRQVDSFPKPVNLRFPVRHVNDGIKFEEKIVIPPRIDRKPTDILKALASTVNFDHTAFHYKYPDDPFFYPYKTGEKRAFGLSLESGRKSAKWIVNENPGFFKHQLADPPIEVFFPKIINTDETKYTEESLLTAINERNVSNAIKIYDSLKSEKHDIQKSVKQSLLELVCFYNGEDRPEVNLETKWCEGYLGKFNTEDGRSKKWNARGFAESLFEEMDPDCPLANSAIIQGLLKYREIDSGVKIYESAKVKKIKLSVGVYNSLLSESYDIVNHKNNVADFVMGILKEMAENNVKPNLATLNATLKSLSRTSHILMAQNLVKEFLNLGVEPSLGSYGYLFNIIRRLKASRDSEVHLKSFCTAVIEHVENKEHEILHPSDLDFFTSAMDWIAEGAADGDLAMRLFDIYLKPNNTKFIVKASSEHALMKQFFLVLFRTQPIDVAMDMYRRYVFTLASPESKIVRTIIEAIHESFQFEYLVEFWKDMIKLGFSYHRPIVSMILAIMKDCTDEKVLPVFREAAINFLEKLDNFKSGDEEVIPNIITAFVKNGDDESIFKVLDLIQNNDFFMDLPESCAEGLLEYAISNKNVPLVLETLKMASRLELTSTSDLAKKALPLLSGGDEAWASSLVTAGKEEERKARP